MTEIGLEALFSQKPFKIRLVYTVFAQMPEIEIKLDWL
jgi:hypothetical protein